jgi:hypothetical protein
MTNLAVETPKQDTKIEEKTTVTQDQSLSQQKIENTQQKPNEQQPETHEDPNWRAFREARKRDRAEKEDAERRAAEKEAEAAALKAAMEAAFSKASPSQYVNPYDQPEETEEQRIERKVNAIIEQKEKQYARDQQEREQREYPSRISRDMPDFKQVCSQEALDYLDYHYPEISRPLQRLPEGYDKWHDIYHAVKKLIPNQVNARKDSMKADMNSQKPKSMASPAPSPTGENPRESFNDAQQRRELNWQRMQRIMKGV